MKTKQFLIHTILFLISYSVSAQKEVVVSTVNKDMSRGLQPGFTVNIPEAKLEAIRPAYEKRLEENTKTRSKEMSGELVNYGVVNKNFSQNPFIIYAKMIETIDGVELTAFVSEDSLNFVSESSEQDKVAAVKKSLHEFAVTEYKKVVTKQLDAENAKLAELKKTQEKQVSQETSNTKSINDKKREIESNKAKIEEGKTQQASKSEQIGRQQKLIEGISDRGSPEYELATKNLKKYEGEKKDLQKNEEKLNRNIDENNADIKEMERENEELKKQQEDSKQKIEAQQAVVTSVETKLNGIK